MGNISSSQKIKGKFSGKDIISLDQFSPKDLSILFNLVKKLKKTKEEKFRKILSGKIISLLFYEPSSRTFSSFCAAVKKLGGQTIEYQNPMQTSSSVKGETLEDTICVFESYCDLLIVRHPQKGTLEKAANCAQSIPVINAGDGIGEHPTQALLDLYTIYEKHKRLNNLTVVFAGDMLNGRTVHSLIRGLSLFKGNRAFLLSPNELRLEKADFLNFKKRGIELIEIENQKDFPKNADVWYWTRVQKERFADQKEYEKVKNRFVLSKKLLNKYGGNNTILMHPLPRVGEILTEVDSDQRALYLKSQVKNGLFVRMALLALILGKI